MPTKSSISPTARTLKYLKEQGILCDIAEHWNSFVGRRKDLFHFIDVIALDPSRGVIGVQCCARSGHAEHRKKILDNEYAPTWLKCGGKIEIHSWGKQKLHRNSKALRWTSKVEEITLSSWENIT